MTKWDVVAIKEIVASKKHACVGGPFGSKLTRKDYVVKSGVPVSRGNNLRIGSRYFHDKDFVFVSWEKAETLRQNMAYPGDLIFTQRGTIGQVALIPENSRFPQYILSQNQMKLTPNRKRADVNYLLYYFLSPRAQERIQNDSIGSTIPGFNLTQLRSFPVPLPPLPEQKAIASVLASLDDKIDLLHRQNHTLEALAQTLFRQWFVEEAKEEWEVGKLGDEFDFTMGLSPPGNSYNEEGLGTPMYQGNADFGFRFPRERVFTTDPKRMARPLDTLISVRAPVGAQNMALKNCCIGRGVAAFRYQPDKEFYTYTYYKLMSQMGEIRQFNDSGTVFGSIGKKDFNEMDVVLPPFARVQEFENAARPINDKIIKNTIQISSLENIRDTLLPKLLSGEVRVQYDEAHHA